MRGSCHRSTAIATVVSRVLYAASICARVTLLAGPATLCQATESKALATDIPAQPLAQALAVFRHQTGLQLIYVSSLISSQRSQAVAAGMQADEALARLLQGTGLRFEHLTPRSIRIFAGAIAPPRETTVRAPTREMRDEVIVTASRGVESGQDVPITIQSIPGDRLNWLNVTTAADLLKYTTNVTFSGDGPGTGNIFVRGLGGSGTGNQSQATIAPFPSVALYLDDQSMQFPARNNDVYLVDMERVEVLEGPQGTLFGGGALAGAIRYITNKPQLEAASGEFAAGYGVTAGGDPNTNVNAVLNVPLVQDKFALRAVMFSDRRGGYIDNIPATIGYIPGTIPYDLGGNPTANNGPLHANNTNPVEVHGLRLSALWRINDSWDALLQQNYQDMHSDGYFFAYPMSTDGRALQRYQITAFAPAFNKDRYQSTALTISGKIGSILNVVYSGSYMTRSIDSQQDYSNYLRSTHGAYYACSGQGAGYYYFRSAKPTSCYVPVASWRDQVRNTHISHELRLTTNEDYRIRGLVGVFYEKFDIYDDMNFNFLAIPQCNAQNLTTSAAGGPDCVTSIGPMAGFFAWHPGYRTNTNTAFGQDVLHGYNQTAFLLSANFDIIPKVLTINGGARHYKYDEFEHGSEYFSATSTVLNVPNGTCTHCGFGINLNKSESGWQGRANLTWHIMPDVMAYYTWSQGFRPGGFNRTASNAAGDVVRKGLAPFSAPNSATQQYEIPTGYSSDSLINNEVGIKSEFLDHHVLFNVSVYYMKWQNIQQLLFDPAHLGNAAFNVNGSSYTLRGFEVQFVARVTDGLSVQGATSVNTPSQSSTPCLISVGVDPNTSRTANNPTPKGSCITQVNGAPYPNPFGQLGTRPPFSPPWMFNLLARYDLTTGAYKPFAWIGASHVASMSNEPANFPDGNAPSESPPTGWPTTTLLRYQIPAYTAYDGGLGVAKDAWTAQIQCHNLTNAYGPTNISSSQFIKAEVPLRPRVVTFLIAYRY